MKTGHLWRLTFWLLPMIAGGGCATQALWDGHLNASNEPAPKTNLRLFVDQPHQDILVVYTEYSERRDSTRTRAYRLNQNERRLAQNKRPHFVSLRQLRGLPEVPVFVGTNTPSAKDGPCAVASADGRSFKLAGEDPSSPAHELPSYDDGKGRLECAALTPLAVGADATVVAAFIAYYYAEATDGHGFDCLACHR